MEAERNPSNHEETVTAEELAAAGLSLVGKRVREGVPSNLLDLYYKDIEGIEVLPPTEVNRLSRLAQQGDNEAKHTLMDSNQGLVINIAKKYFGMGLPRADLIQEGNLGLYRAIEKFDPDLGFKFSTYATWWIRQAITRAIDKKSRTIHLPSDMSRRVRKIERTKTKLAQVLDGEEPSPEAIADELGLAVEKVTEIDDFAYVAESLDQPLGEVPGSTFGDSLTAVSEYTQEVVEEIRSSQEERTLKEAIHLLPEEERRVIELYYGLNQQPQLNFAEICAELGLKKGKASEVHSNALDNLRRFPELERAAYDPENFEPVDEKSEEAMSEETEKLKANAGTELTDSAAETWATMLKLGTTDKKAIAKARGKAESTIKEHRSKIKTILEVSHIDEVLPRGRKILESPTNETS